MCYYDNDRKGGSYEEDLIDFSMCLCFTWNYRMCIRFRQQQWGTDTNGNKKTSFSINETAVFEDVHYTVTNVEYPNGSEYDTPADGKNYVIVTLKIENKKNEKISYNTYDWKMINSQGQEDDETFTTINNDTGLSSGDLAAGGTKTGTLVYEESKDESSLKLLYYSNSLFDENSTFEIVVK